jgi:hypothetical protein
MISIGAVSRQTGINAATLRKWEARYGFPIPERSTTGHRQYRAHDLQALQDVCRRMSFGERASSAIRAVGRSVGGGRAPVGTHAGETRSDVETAMRLLLDGDLVSLERTVEERVASDGIAAFVRTFATPMMAAVGQWWQAGTLPVYAEHAFSRILQQVVARNSNIPEGRLPDAPLVLFASPAGEAHTLALTLADAWFASEGLRTVHLLGGLPASEIAAAAVHYGAQLVALSVSAAFPQRLLKCELRVLRGLLPPSIPVWIGGGGAMRLTTPMEGVSVMTSIEEAIQNFKEATINQRPLRAVAGVSTNG